jgi:hypothetical protein
MTKLTPEEKAALTEPCVDLPLPEAAGLTKREYFAASALTGAVSTHLNWQKIGSRCASENDTLASFIAKQCVAMADAIIAELAKKP